MATNRGLTGWRRRQAKQETAERREARNPLTADCRSAIAYWRAVDPGAAFVYFVQEETDTSYVKIGWAMDPGKRLAGLQTGNPRRLVVDVVLYSHYLGEQALHSVWSRDRACGEWFKTGQILDWARWAAALQRQQHEDHGDLAFARRLGDKMPSIWVRERTA